MKSRAREVSRYHNNSPRQLKRTRLFSARLSRARGFDRFSSTPVSSVVRPLVAEIRAPSLRSFGSTRCSRSSIVWAEMYMGEASLLRVPQRVAYPTGSQESQHTTRHDREQSVVGSTWPLPIAASTGTRQSGPRASGPRYPHRGSQIQAAHALRQPRAEDRLPSRPADSPGRQNPRRHRKKGVVCRVRHRDSRQR